MEEGKIATIRDRKIPTKTKELSSFLGWTPECQAALDGLKQTMIEGTILGIADVTKPFKVETDASNYALGVFSCRMDLITYESRKLNATEKRSMCDVLREFLQKDPSTKIVMNLAKADYQQGKVEKAKVNELLEPLLVLIRPWESVSMGFITHLLKVDNFEINLVIIDRFSKYATFILITKLCSAELTTHLFFKRREVVGSPDKYRER
ncbi:reverse transcriptase [Cucumis melo var. makuwa]|uniref:Reverse transcriptase n=1 Tax=Cucumis melo var. makuwa TaxID=1194695 RepID=A0A5D3DXA2_CUCMM|nr:reverse transcriptase [Cucumis melo var. makuwa]